MADENMLAIFDPELDSSNNIDFPDLDFLYDDADAYANEIAELYSYTENNEFQLNVKAFEEQMESYNLPPSWQKLSATQKKNMVLKLMDQLDMSKKASRMKAIRCLLYLAQGCWAEIQSDQEQQNLTRDNVMLMYELGVFAEIIELLNLEIENSYTANIAIRKIAVSLADSVDLRVILSILYIITEVMRNEKTNPDISEHHKSLVEGFVQEINQPFGDELLSVKLLGMITRFCSGSAPHFPMKKVLLLLWKISLISLGGMDELKALKEKYRKEAGLAPIKEDTFEITKVMRASSPPATTTTGDDAINQKRNRPFRRSLMKQSSLDEQEQLEMENPPAENEEDLSEYYRQFDDPNNAPPPPPIEQKEPEISAISNEQSPCNAVINELKALPRLPWSPKVREKDLELFLESSRNKFIGFTLLNDLNTLAGLPQPIKEGVEVLKRHMYVSLSDIQIKKEEQIVRNPLLAAEKEIPNTPTEMLYQAILPNLPQYMISLLKILLAAAPTSKAKTDSINIMADVLPEDMPMTVAQSTKLGIDVNRHKEIIVKAVSAILLLYLKHFKISHIYQFEFMAQHLVFANCVPLVLKFLNQNIMSYVGSKHNIPIMDFPSCVLGEQNNELTSDSIIIGDSAPYCWRNIFSCINLLRVLNKLTKWKHSRIMMLVVFKSAPILKRTLKVRHAMMQLYVLKLLKMQTKYLGRQWRKSNMKTISAIYSKVRHRLGDDWAFGNDLDARPWDYQSEECTLRTCVDAFNQRRYSTGVNFRSDANEFDFSVENLFQRNISNCQQANLNENEEIVLSEEFKQNYELWLEQEVFKTQIDWDMLINPVVE